MRRGRYRLGRDQTRETGNTLTGFDVGKHQIRRTKRNGDLIAELDRFREDPLHVRPIAMGRLGAKVGQVGQRGDPSSRSGRTGKSQLDRGRFEKARKSRKNVSGQFSRLAIG